MAGNSVLLQHNHSAFSSVLYLWRTENEIERSFVLLFLQEKHNCERIFVD
jgi:hypothetical protein